LSSLNARNCGTTRLLGFTLEAAQAEYLGATEACREERLDLADDEFEPPPDFLSFEEFYAFATTHAVQSLDDTFIKDQSEARVRGALFRRKRGGPAFLALCSTIGRPIRNEVISGA
jgi:hypothetical protein